MGWLRKQWKKLSPDTQATIAGYAGAVATGGAALLQQGNLNPKDYVAMASLIFIGEVANSLKTGE